MLLATIIDTTTGESRQITRSPGATAPACLQFSHQACGYWEGRFELFEWACNASGMDPFEALFIDGFTGEVLDYDGLMCEASDEMEAVA